MAEVSTKPYLIRAIVEWCNDAGFTPYVAVAVDGSVRVPVEYVKNGEIVLNISTLATQRLLVDNDAISFQARFSGAAREVFVPMARVIAVYARENGQGMAFEVPRGPAALERSAELRNDEVRSDDARAELAAVVPVNPAATAEESAPPPQPPAGERPRLTRIK
jgi:stringent starvation protein B